MIFTFNGVRSDTYNVKLLDRIDWNVPKRDYTTKVIPGRDGTLTLDNHRFADTTGKLRCYTEREWFHNYENFKAFLLKDVAKHQLIDEIEPDVYRMARVIGFQQVAHSERNTIVFDIELEMAPKKFLICEDLTVSVGTVNISNPTLYESKPLIVAAGNGTITFGGYTITLSGVTGATTIDCESLNAYSNVNENSNVSFSGEPVFPVGDFTLTTTVALTIKPRWCTV